MKYHRYSAEQIAEIADQLAHVKNTVLQRKYQAIHLSMQGYTSLAVAEMVGCSANTVGQYIHLYKTQGLLGLVPQKSTERPTFMTAEQGQALYQVIQNHSPHEVGFPGRYNWTASLASSWLKLTYGVEYAQSSMLQQLHQLGLSYSRPSDTMASADKEKQALFIKQLDAEKKTVKWRN
ncbi:transposase [Enterococcus sp. BWB1-3]|uniref:helix-turn-helix domain-containing protein n=1 Tax=Enterococcus sp. BWB1-3 TaxID=2787713 RepID=UPI0019205907|nr:winged helix-turn-helix domain-containing protein [Enterococcus sp. BWB1-3]MBL1230057.1 transposase [Enterococcus sp. BWB1-3]